MRFTQQKQILPQIDQLSFIIKPVEEELALVNAELKNIIADDSPLDKFKIKNLCFSRALNNLIVGGKRIRPVLVLLSAKAVGCEARNAVPIAVSMELIHTASLVHDDLLDGSKIRRGIRTINSRWGKNAAILIGDKLLVKAMQTIIDNDNSSNGSNGIARLILQMSSHLYEGEVLQFHFRNNPAITIDDYFEIISKKTASFISACCETGAIIGKASQDYCQALKRYGLNAGIAFQIIDDVLNFKGKNQKLGKETGSDFKEGRFTLPLILFANQASEADKEQMMRLFDRKNRKGVSINEVNALLAKYDCFNQSVLLAYDYANKASENLGILPLSEARSSLEKLAYFFVGRDY